MAQYTFNGSEGGPISLETAKQWVANYRDQNPGQTTAHFFGFEILQTLLREANCVGIRMYYAIDENGTKQLVLVGVDSNGNNLIPASGSSPANNYVVVDTSMLCPPYCPPNSNTDL